MRKIFIGIIIVVIIVMIVIAIQAYRITHAHPEENKVTVQEILEVNFKDGVFYINDERKPKLALRRGVYYEFCNSSDEPLYFTLDKHGGPGMPKNIAKNKKFKPLADGSLFLRVTDDLPDDFYYQSSESKGAGNRIKLIENTQEF